MEVIDLFIGNKDITLCNLHAITDWIEINNSIKNKEIERIFPLISGKKMSNKVKLFHSF